MKRYGPSPDLGPVNPHEIQGVCIHDVEVAASIHEHLGESGVDDEVNDKWVPPRIWDIVQLKKGVRYSEMLAFRKRGHMS
jgi:hypothetical protein